MGLPRNAFFAAFVVLFLLLEFSSVIFATSPQYANPSVDALAKTPGSQRLIVYSASHADRNKYVALGCAITHNFSSATSLICPSGVNIQNSIPDKIYNVTDLTSDQQISANSVWPSYTGSGITVAVLDTGIDYTNAQLTHGTGSGDPGNGHCFAVAANDCGGGFFDDFGHGTHVAGILMSSGNADANNGAFSKGVAPNANVWMGKVCDNHGQCYTSDIAAGIQYVVSNHISNVMSMSLGGGGTTGPNCDSDFLANTVNWAYSYNVITVAAAGNYGSTTVASPGCASNTIAVGAVDSGDNLASFSSHGTALQAHGVTAPGVSIYSTVPTGSCTLCSPTGYAYLSGTSMATPHVAATIALMLQKNHGLSPAQIRSILFGSADCLGNRYGTCPNTIIGWGRINALAAVQATPLPGAIIIFVPQPTPPFQTISQGFTATTMTDAGATGGSGSYTYSWLEEAPAASSYTAATDCVNPTPTSCTFSPTTSNPTGVYKFELHATDGTLSANSLAAEVGVSTYIPLSVPGPSPATANLIRPTEQFVYNNWLVSDAGASGGDGSGSYTYQWLVETPGSSSFVIPTGNSFSCAYSPFLYCVLIANWTTTSGNYIFELNASDTSGRVTSATATITLVPGTTLARRLPLSAPTFITTGSWQQSTFNTQTNPGATLALDGVYGYLSTTDSWSNQSEGAAWEWDFGQQYNGSLETYWYAVDNAGSCGSLGTNVSIRWMTSLDNLNWHIFAYYPLSSFTSIGSAGSPINYITTTGFRYVKLSQFSDTLHAACPLNTYVDSVILNPSNTTPTSTTTTTSSTSTSSTSTTSSSSSTSTTSSSTSTSSTSSTSTSSSSTSSSSSSSSTSTGTTTVFVCSSLPGSIGCTSWLGCDADLGSPAIQPTNCCATGSTNCGLGGGAICCILPTTTVPLKSQPTTTTTSTTTSTTTTINPHICSDGTNCGSAYCCDCGGGYYSCRIGRYCYC